VKAVTALTVLVTCLATTKGQTVPEPNTTAPAPPAYTPVRWNENYSYLKDSANRSDPFDALKYISLGPDDWYLSLGGQVRYRYEYFSNENFGAVENDWGYALQRYLLHLDAHFGPNIRVFVQGKSSLVDDGREPTPSATSIEPRPTDADEADLQQLFIDVKLPSGEDAATIRVGRQDLIYGAQRLIGPLDWTNVRRTFEGGKVSYQVGKKHTIDAFLVRPVIVEKEECNSGDGDTTFGGIYATFGVPERCLPGSARFEAFALGLWKQAQVDDGADLDTDTYTIGGRLSAAPKPFDYDIELAYQFGNSGSGDISAYSIATEAGYTFADVACTPRPFIGFDYASGDDDPNDSDTETFNQLFPTGHLFFGYIDVVGRQNIVDLHLGIELTLLQNHAYAKKLTLRGDYHYFCRASDDDALYAASGSVLRADTGTDAKFIGSEIDLLLTWQIDRHTQVYVGYSHFFVGDFINETNGPDDDIDYAYAAVTFTF